MSPQYEFNAPFTKSQVTFLNGMQQNPNFVPQLCCGTMCQAPMVATVNGWLCPYCNHQKHKAITHSKNKINEYNSNDYDDILPVVGNSSGNLCDLLSSVVPTMDEICPLTIPRIEIEIEND